MEKTTPAEQRKQYEPKTEFVYLHYVWIPKTETTFEKKVFTIEKVAILAESERQFVIAPNTMNNLFFHEISKDKKDKYSSSYVIDRKSIHIQTRNSYEPFNGIRYVQFSTKKTKPEKIRAEIQLEIEKEYGWLGSIDLSFIN